MGTRPFRSIRIFASSLSTHVTSLPVSARQAPRTSPTYPLPTTVIFMRHKKRGLGRPLKPVRVSPVDCGVNILNHKDLLSLALSERPLAPCASGCESKGGTLSARADSDRLPSRVTRADGRRRIRARADTSAGPRETAPGAWRPAGDSDHLLEGP